MIPRALAPSILDSAKKYPVVTVTGPRQSGKTTLIKNLFPDRPYFSMETPDVRALAEDNPQELFARFGHQLVIDEVQRTPRLLSYIQTIVDEDREASFILSGSHNLLMLENVSQTLAGRTAIQYLLPLSLQEASNGGIAFENYEQAILQGLYPRVYDRGLEASEFFANYIETYLQRDVRQIKNIGNLGVFNRFLAICAAHVGQTINYSNLANAAGVSVNTAQSWLAVLETSFIVYQLHPYFRNFNKRITKASKLYFYDTGVACSLLRITNRQGVENYYQKGALFENLIVNEVCKSWFNRGLRPPLYFWRDHTGHEIDLLTDLGGRLKCAEIKASRTFSGDFFNNLAWFANVAGLPIEDNTVVYGGEQDWQTEHGLLLPWRKTHQLGAD